jgi:hypothetical protein
LPAVTVCVEGATPIEKSATGAAVTTKLVVAEWVRAPLVPVTVRVDVAAGVVVLVVTVIVEDPLVAIVGGEKLAEAPVGKPLALSVTVPVNPFRAPMVTVYVVELPAVTVCVEGATPIEKSATGAAVTTRLVVAEWLKAPLVPVTVRVDVAAGVVVLVVTVIVEVPLAVTVVGLKLAEAPVGNPLALSVTTPVNPFRAPIVTVYVVELPALTVWEAGDAEREKSGADATTRLEVAECVRLPLVPVIVSVEVPVGVVPVVVTVIVEVPLVVTVAGEKLALAPVGRPLALSVTVPVNPFRAPIVTV